MGNEQDELREPQPRCAFCNSTKDQVKVLAKVHAKYICDKCCADIKIAMKIPIDIQPPEAA